MSIGGIGLAGRQTMEYGTAKAQKTAPGHSFASRLENTAKTKPRTPAGYMKTGDMLYSGVQGAGQDYGTYESENYKIVPDKEAGCFDIYNGQGEHLGAFFYSDIKIRRDCATGKEFLISEKGTAWYDALVLDGELKEGLQNAMGVDSLEAEGLQGYTVRTHSGTGIQYLLKDGEEGRGGKVLLQSESDRQKYEALAEAYCSKYPSLVKDKNAGYFWASNEIRGMAECTEQGILSIHYDSLSYSDNSNSRNNWCIVFSEDIYRELFEWIQKNGKISAKASTWQDILDGLGCQYQRIWSKEEEAQGYLNN